VEGREIGDKRLNSNTVFRQISNAGAARDCVRASAVQFCVCAWPTVIATIACTCQSLIQIAAEPRQLCKSASSNKIRAVPEDANVLRTITSPKQVGNGYPTSDGRPMAETDFHRLVMTDLIETLEDWFSDTDDVYASGNLLVFYEAGNKRKHVSPDVFVVFGVSKHPRLNYLLWEEGRAPAVVIEITSTSTRKEDRENKFALYRDVLQVSEYFLFDPFGDYLKPRFQGYRLVAGEYRPMRLADGRLTSRKLGLTLEPDGVKLRLVDPKSGRRLPTRSERIAVEEAARSVVEAENEQLRRELEELKRERRK
jgi:Uma2 family endonuclease